MNNPMKAFVGVDFDCEFRNSAFKNWSISRLIAVNDEDSMSIGARKFVESSGYESELARPRADAQVINLNIERNKNILVDGFVWEVRWFNDIAGVLYSDVVSNELLEEMIGNDITDIEWIAFKGVEKGSEFEEWAIVNDIPVISI